MPEVHVPEPGPSVLARFLREHREAILSAWEAAERRSGVVPRDLDRGALIDEIPLLLERLAAGAEAGAEGSTIAATARSVADRHAVERLRLGLDLGDVAVEYALLRRTILEQAAAAGVVLPLEERLGFHEALDAAMIRPVARQAAAHTRALEALDRVSADAMAGGDLDRLLRRLLAVAVELIEAVDRAAILLFEGNTARVRAALGEEHTPGVSAEYRADEGLLARISRERVPVGLRLRTGEPLGLGPEVPGEPEVTVHAVPLLGGGRVLGAAVIGSATAPEFAPGDLAIFRTLAERAAVIVTRHCAQAERERLLDETRAALAREEETRRRLEENEALTAAFFANAPSVIFVKDLEGRYTLVNHRPLHELRLSERDYLGHLDRDLFPGEAAAAIRANDRRVLEHRSTLIAEEVVPYRDGIRTYLSVKFPLLDREGRPYALGGIATDITERKRAEAGRDLLAEATSVLAESLDYEATLARVVELGGTRFADYCLLDLVEDGGTRRLAVQARDPAMNEILERSKPYPSVPDRPGPWAPVFRGEPVLLAQVTPEHLDRLARTGEHRELLGTVAPRSLLAVPLGIRGRVFGILVMGTTQRTLDRADLAVAAELGRRAALAIESARLYREAREAVRAREEFLSIAAHELKTPLTALHLNLQLLRRGLGAGEIDPACLATGLDRAIGQSSRLTQLLDHLLDLSRATAGRLVLEREPVDLAGLVAEVVARLAEPLAAAGCSVSVRADAPLVGNWDRIRIEQVLTNLLSNAIRYAPGAPVEVEARPAGGCACLRVRDHGPGLTPGALAGIFSPYQRATESLAAGGLGLGLFISRQIVQAHGGTIGVESAPGGGATFTVRLPFSGIPCPPEAPP